MSKDVELPTVTNVDSVIGRVESSTRGRSATTYTETRSFRNNLGYPVSIVDRNNIVVTLPPTAYAGSRSEIIIEHKINFTDNVNLNWDTVLNDNNRVTAIEAIRELTKNKEVKVTNLGNEFIIEYSITHVTLARNSYVAYFEELDIVITKSAYAHTTIHPYSAIGQNMVLATTDNPDGFYYRVIINDPYSEFGERYINVNGNVFKVRRTVDASTKPGIYVHSKDECNLDSRYSPGRNSTYISFEDADKQVPLYQTSQQAATLGDVFYKQEQDIKTKENDAKQKLAELNVKKIELDSRLKEMEYKHKQEYMNLERENIRLKDELEREKLLREQDAQREKFTYEKKSRRDKDDFESRSYARKDTTEFIKWLPGLIAGIVGIANVLVMLQRVKP